MKYGVSCFKGFLKPPHWSNLSPPGGSDDPLPLRRAEELLWPLQRPPSVVAPGGRQGGGGSASHADGGGLASKWTGKGGGQEVTRSGRWGEFTNVPMGIEWEYHRDRKPSDLFLLWVWAWMIYSQSIVRQTHGCLGLATNADLQPTIFFGAGHLRSAMTIGMMMMMMMMMNTAQTL